MRAKNKGPLIIIGSVALTASITFGGTYWYKNTQLNNTIAEYDLAIEELVEELNAARYSAVTTLVDIKQGTVITEDMVKADRVTYGGNPLVIKGDIDTVIGSIARTDIAANDIVTNSMVSEFDPEDDREKEAAFIRLNSNMVENDLVDVRIVFSNGEDYIVLAKQHLRNLDLANNNTFLWLNEEEILLLDSAVVDASLHEGAFIYVTKYLDGELQDESTVTYMPNESVLALIRRDPNVVERATKKMTVDARKALEDRLKEFTTENGLVTSIDIRNENVVLAGSEVTEEEETVTDPNVSQEDITTGVSAPTTTEVDTEFQGVTE